MFQITPRQAYVAILIFIAFLTFCWVVTQNSAIESYVTFLSSIASLIILATKKE